jgi:hypothetical protein
MIIKLFEFLCVLFSLFWFWENKQVFVKSVANGGDNNITLQCNSNLLLHWSADPVAALIMFELYQLYFSSDKILLFSCQTHPNCSARMQCVKCSTNPAAIKRPKDGTALCKECFFGMFENEIHETIIKHALFTRGQTVAIGASGSSLSLSSNVILKVQVARTQPFLRTY